MKIDGYGQAKILTPQEIAALFALENSKERDRALYAVMLYTACRVSEAVQLRKRDVFDRRGNVRPMILFRKPTTKGKLATREIPVIEDLRLRLEVYQPRKKNPYLFPGLLNSSREDIYLHQDSALWLLRQACKKIGLEGISTHSFRRTALTQMSNAGIPLRVIQQISGHRTLDELYKYLEVSEEQVLGAASSLSVLTPPKPSNNVHESAILPPQDHHNTTFGIPTYVEASSTNQNIPF